MNLTGCPGAVLTFGLVVAGTALTLAVGATGAAAVEEPACRGEPAAIVGTSEADVLRGTPGADVIVGLGGADRLRGGGGDDVLCGGNGDDKLRGGASDDRMFGGHDARRGQNDSQADFLSGGRGADRMVGGNDGGNERLLQVVQACGERGPGRRVGQRAGIRPGHRHRVGDRNGLR